MNNMNKWGKLSMLSLCVLALSYLTSCESNNAPDVSGIEVQLKSDRLDIDLLQVDTNNIGEGVARLASKYPNVLDFYLDTLMGFGINGDYTNENPAIQKGLRVFLTHKDYRGVFDTVATHFPDTKSIEDELVKGLKYYKHYMGDVKEPHIVYVVSGLNNWGAFSFGQNNIGIGLDMFLGKDYPYYKSVGIPAYMNTKLDKKYLPVAMFRSMYQEEHPFKVQGSTLLDMMVQRGKEMYFVSQVLPFIPEHVRLGYTEAQLEWCEANEAMIYDFFVRENLIYDNNIQKVVRYVMDGPSSAGMPDSSPGDIGSWLGLQIVKQYMSRNKELPLKDFLAKDVAAQQILTDSKYKPK